MGNLKPSYPVHQGMSFAGIPSISQMRIFFDGALDGICLIDRDGCLLYVNPSLERTLGVCPACMEGSALAGWLDPAVVDLIREGARDVPFRHKLKTLDGRVLDLDISARLLCSKNEDRTAVFVRFTEGSDPEPLAVIPKREKMFRKAEQEYRAIVEAQTELIERFLPNFTIVYVNDAYCRYFGETRDELVGRNFRHHMLAGDIAAMEAEMARLTPEHPTETAEERSLVKNGERRWTQWIDTGIFDDRGNLVEVQSVGRDVTDRKLLELELRRQRDRAERYLDVAGVMVVAFDPEGRIVMINGEGCRLLGADREKLLGLAWCDNFVPFSCREQVRSLFSKAPGGDLDPGEVYENQILDCQGKERYFQWRNLALVDEKGHFQGLLSSGIDVTQRERDKQALLNSKAELQRSLDRLEGIWENTVEMLSQATELRDPYTAGHQKKVAALAVAIAEEMGFSGDSIQAVRMAALIHDVGKQGIPAEILSKPGKLRDVEFNLIRRHSEVAADIIRQVGFPWDLAEIVWQHHERMDGSGYPRALRGEEILVEARILAVADVVEAISSHRPYRPALGLNAALEEIKENSGVLYDPDVVRACLAVFRHNVFSFS